MEYNKLYLAEYFNETRLISAKNTKEAIDLLYEVKNQEYKQEERRRDFRPKDLKITELGDESLIIRASE
ncbi:hypothetical protein [Peribacillus frigoritolerans]|uniref:hypothetical protein n=1 Tax=Peribacillus frigoritolerans TaxID=450367 RepID=UPI002161D26F|nr:hypothetical protein [Peribacillus frigoritolerans]